MTVVLQMSIVFEQGDDGFIVGWVPEVPGTLSQGRTREEARANVIDALRLMLSPSPDDAETRDREQLRLIIAA